MEKKQFLIPQILGVLLAFSVITSCEEPPPVYIITVIDLSGVKPEEGKIALNLDKSGISAQYKITLTWFMYKNSDDYDWFRDRDGVSSGTIFKTAVNYYEADFTLEANEGCVFPTNPRPKIQFENFRRLVIDEGNSGSLIITGTVTFSPLQF